MVLQLKLQLLFLLGLSPIVRPMLHGFLLISFAFAASCRGTIRILRRYVALIAQELEEVGVQTDGILIDVAALCIVGSTVGSWL